MARGEAFEGALGALIAVGSVILWHRLLGGFGRV